MYREQKKEKHYCLKHKKDHRSAAVTGGRAPGAPPPESASASDIKLKFNLEMAFQF